MKSNTLQIKNLHAEVEKKKILHGINLTIKSGEIHALMGPNGSGKSTLCNVLMGHPKYSVTKGEVKLNRKNILKMSPDERAKAGIFIGFQNPYEVPGVSFSNFLRQSFNNIKSAQDGLYRPISPYKFLELLNKKAKDLNIPESIISRSLNYGLSGGEKKRTEVLQLSILEPKICLLDEIDSGLDIDSLRSIAEGLSRVAKLTNMGVLLITHYQRILDYIKPDFVHVICNGKITNSGGKELAKKLEKRGYKKLLKVSKENLKLKMYAD